VQSRERPQVKSAKEAIQEVKREQKVHVDVAQPLSISRNSKSKFNLIATANEEQKKLIEK
jgi:hypothetical protein